MVPKYIVITCGDPSGVGYEVILKILNKISYIKNTTFTNFVPLLIAEQKYINFYLKKFNLSLLKPTYINKEIFSSIKDLTKSKNNLLCIIPKINHKINNLFIGESNKYSGEITLSTLDTGIELISKLIQENKIVGLLTMPVSKNAISEYLNKCWSRKNFITQELKNLGTRKLEFLGHTEYIAEKFGINPKKVSMLMIGKDKKNIEYKTLLLTRHIPLSQVGKNLNSENIVSQVLNVSTFLQKYELNQNSKLEIMFCGVNPHTGENEKIGTEEKTILIPAINKLNKIIKNKNLNMKKIRCPMLTEQAFMYAKKNKNVLIVCSYHDQAMLPLKLLCGHNIVNITVGLPFIRVSPGHGTAEDIAGKGVADITPTFFAIEKLIKYLLCQRDHEK